MNEIITDLIVAGVGAFFGGGLRCLLSDELNTDFDHLRWGTIVANMIGSTLIGIFVGMVSRHQLQNTLNILLATGFCGGLTTFSTFSFETLKYFKLKRPIFAWAYWLGSVITCMACVFVGLWMSSWN